MSVRFLATIEGVVEDGRGIGAEVMKDPVVLFRIQTAVDQEIVRGKLLSPYRPGGEIESEWEVDTGQAGYFWSPALVAGHLSGSCRPGRRARLSADANRGPVREVHLWSARGLSDGARITVSPPED
jgi:hypothetical protein